MTDYTVKQLADLAGITVRTLHYYDEIGLLKPPRVGENGYRYYNDETLFQLQQILFFRELDLGLEEIKQILDTPGFDLLATLQVHRNGLEARIRQLKRLISTIDGTIHHLSGEVKMSEKQLFSGFSEEDEKRYAQQAREQYGREEVDASYKRWNEYSKERQEQIKLEGQQIYLDIAALIEREPDAPEVQAVVGRWHQHMRHFYEPSIGRLRGLGEMYNSHPDFRKLYTEIHPGLPEFLRDAIAVYCNRLQQQPDVN